MRHLSFGETSRSMLDKIIARVRVAKVQKLINSEIKLLDLGCGYNGDLINTLSSKQNAVGMDLSVNPKMKNLKSGRVDRKLPFNDASFDVVTALAIIEHVDDPGTMLDEVFRVLKKGGKVVITTPSLMGKLPLEIMARLGLISKTEIDDHKRYYTKNTLYQALVDAGFTKVQVNHFGILWLNLFAKATKE